MQSSTPPAVNQLPYAVGSGKDTSVADDAAKGGVVVQAYSPLNSGSLATDPDCAAIGKRHGKSAAQVALRWIVQRNATLCGHFAACLPKPLARADAGVLRAARRRRTRRSTSSRTSTSSISL